MSLSSTFRVLGLALGLIILDASAITVTVPASANPWLAGAANGTTGQSGVDVAPAQSPVVVTVQAGDTLSLFAAGSIEPSSTGITPEGDTSEVRSQTALNGIGGITGAPLYSLIGVFLDASVPTTGSEPSNLDFSGANRDYATLAPALRQPFFIGNGMDKTGTRQQITVPTGATRLLLGSMFVNSWYYRTGSLSVTVETAPTASNGITWGTPFTVTGPSDVSTGGALIGAYSIAASTGSPNPGVTLNGVSFSGLVTQYLGASAGPFTLYGSEMRGYNGFGDSVAPYTDLDADYRTLLKSGVYDNSIAADGYTLTIGDLEIGEEYSIQFWVNESNGGTNSVASPNATVITDVNSVTLDRNTLNQVGGVGQSVTGTFTANSTNRTFRITSSHGGPAVLNAFQLRKLTTLGPEIVVTGPSVGAAGEELVYEIAVDNLGAAEASGLVVEVWLPEGTTKVLAPGSSTLFGGDDEGVTWNLASLPAGESVTYSLTVTSAAEQTLAPSAFAARAYLKKTGVGTLGTADFPATVVGPPLPPVLAATSFKVAANGKKGASVGDQYANWSFEATQPLDPGKQVFQPVVQYKSGENGSVWADLPGGTMRRSGPGSTLWTLVVPMTIDGGSFFFRVETRLAGKAKRSLQAAGIYFVTARSLLQVEVTRASQLDPQGTTTRPGDIVRYDVTVRNVGSIPANNVVVFGPVPAGMKDPAGSSAQLSTGPTFPAVLQRDSKEKDLGLTWSIPAMPAGASATMNYSCIVLDNAKVGTLVGPTGIGAAQDVLAITNTKTFTAAITKIKSNTGSQPSLIPLARVNAGLSMNVVASGGIATVGGTMTYTVSIQNLYQAVREEAVVWVRLPKGTQFESFGQASGINFNGTANTAISKGTNPSLRRDTFEDSGVMTWNLGTMAARENRTLVFTVRVGAELANTVVNADGSTSPNEIRLVEYNFRTRGGSNPFYTFPRPTISDTKEVALNLLEQAVVRCLITVPGPEGLPILGISKELIGENDGYVNQDGVEMASVIVDDKVNEVHQVRSVIGISNRGGAAARLCQVVDAISPDLIFDGGVLVNGLPAVSGSVKLFDKGYREITSSVIAADSRRVFQAEVVMFEVGNIAPGATLTIDYKMRPKKMAVRDITKPIKEAVALKVGSIFPIPAPSLYSNSFTEAIPCRMTDPQGIVVSNASLSTYVYPVKSNSTFGELQAYNTVIRNNGGGASGSVTFKATIPLKQAVYVESNFVDVDTGSVSAATAMTTKQVAGQASEISVIVPTIPGGRARILQVVLRIKDQAQIKAADRQADEKITLNVVVTQTAAASASMAAKTVADGGAGLIPGATGTQTMEGVSNLDSDPNGPKTFVMKTTLLSVREGELLPYTITFGNHGETAATGGTLAIIVPKDCDVVETGPQFTTGGFLPAKGIKAGGKVSWSILSLAPGEVQVRQLVVRPKLGVKRIGGTIVEASCTFQCANASEAAPGKTVTRVLNGNFVVFGLRTVGDAIGGFFNGLGALLTGRNDAKIQAIEAAAAQISRGNLATTIAGVSYMTIGDTIILPLGGNRVVAAGAGNIVAAGAGNIVAGGAGNIIAGGAGNIVAAGAGNLIANDGASLTSANIAALVGSSTANVVNLGAGNLYLKGTNQLIANDGGSLLGSVLAATSGVVAAGGGNIVASGGGNIVAAGAGNIVAAGAGNIVAGGAGNVANPGSSASVVVATPGGNLVGGSALRLANQVPSGIVAGGAGNIVAGGAGNIVAGGAGN